MPEQIDEVLLDVNIIKSGAVIHYIIDPFEIQTFCFPAHQARNRSWSWVVNNVVALYEVFYGHAQRPILLDEYNYELMGIINHFRRQIKEGLDGTSSFETEEALEELGVNLVAALAVAIGIFSEGFARLKDLLGNRLATTDTNFSDDCPVLDDCFHAQRAPGYAIDVAVDCYRAILENYGRRTKRRMPGRQQQRIRNSIIVDAQAVSRLIEIQKAVLGLCHSGRLRRHHVFYYISSAERTSTLFDVLRKKEKLPRIQGQLFKAWRTPQQILLRLICTGKDEAESIERLKKVRDIVEILSKQGAVSFDERVLSPKLQDQLGAYRLSISRHFEQVQKYGLAPLLSAGKRFHQLLEREDDENWTQKAREEIKNFIREPEWDEKARNLVNLNLFFTGAKILTDSLFRNLAEVDKQAESSERHSARRGRDPVAGSRQHLPTVFLVRPDGYDSVMETIKRYFETPIHGKLGQRKMIARACRKFLERDREVNKLDAEQIGHEFVRNLLFLALPPADADRFALDHALEMIDRIENMVASTRDVEKITRLREYDREFRCLACWAARRQAQYGLGDRLATNAIEIYSEEDGRFFHARCLNTYAWLSDFRDFGGAKPHQRVTTERAIRDAVKAMICYRTRRPEAEAQVGVLYNTMACLFVYRLDGYYSEVAARIYLNFLKREVDKGTWLDRYPEYFHTEALVEYEEYKALWGRRADVNALLDKLKNARREIQFAYEMYEQNPRADLKHRDQVEVLRSQILDSIHELEGKSA